MTAIGVTNLVKVPTTANGGARLEATRRTPRARQRPAIHDRATGWFDYDEPDEHQLVLLQGDRRHAGDPSDGSSPGRVRAIGVSNFVPSTSVDCLPTRRSSPPSTRSTASLLPAEGHTGASRRARHPHPGLVTDRRDHAYYGGGKSAFDDPTLQAIARDHGKSPAQVMLRWHLQQGRSAIPKSTKPARIAENFDVFDFVLSEDHVAAIDALDTAVRRGPEPDNITLETYGKEIPRRDRRGLAVCFYGYCRYASSPLRTRFGLISVCVLPMQGR
jgi:hypothetical protein